MQIPTKAKRDRTDDIVIIDPGPGNVVNAFGEVIFANKCGAYRNFVYTLVDQEGEKIVADLSIIEVLTNYQGTSNVPQPVPKNSTTTDGVFGDTIYVGDAYPYCPTTFSFTQTQGFKVEVGGTTYNLTTKNSMAGSKNSSGTYTYTVTNTVP